MLVTTELLARLTSRGLTAHLVRGAIAIGIFAVGTWLTTDWPYLGVSLMFLALVPIGGCPACWLGGLVESACEVRAPKQPPEPWVGN